jgi:hypothetical protein
MPLVPGALIFVVITLCLSVAVYVVSELGKALRVDRVDVQRVVMAHNVSDIDSRPRFGIAWSQEGCAVQV